MLHPAPAVERPAETAALMSPVRAGVEGRPDLKEEEQQQPGTRRIKMQEPPAKRREELPSGSAPAGPVELLDAVRVPEPALAEPTLVPERVQ